MFFTYESTLSSMEIGVRKIVSALVLGLVMFAIGSAARADTRLLMLEESWCEYCQRWNEEIGEVYAKTTEGRRAPLLRSSIHEPLPTGIALKSRAHYTPTFVLLRDGHEVGRIEGYPGEEFFWGLLNRMLERLPEDLPTKGS